MNTALVDSNITLNCDVTDSVIQSIRVKYPTQRLVFSSDISFGFVVDVINPDYNGDYEKSEPILTRIYLTESPLHSLNATLTF